MRARMYSMRHKKGYTVDANSSRTDAYTTKEYAVRAQVTRLRSTHARGASTLGGVYMYAYAYTGDGLGVRDQSVCQCGVPVAGSYPAHPYTAKPQLSRQ